MVVTRSIEHLMKLKKRGVARKLDKAYDMSVKHPEADELWRQID